MTVMMWRWIRYEQWSSVNNPHRSRYYSNPADTVVISNSPCSASRCFNLIYYYYYHHLFSLLSEKKKSTAAAAVVDAAAGTRTFTGCDWILQGFSKEMWNYSWCWLQMLVSTFRDNFIVFFTKLINNLIAHFIVNC